MHCRGVMMGRDPQKWMISHTLKLNSFTGLGSRIHLCPDPIFSTNFVSRKAQSSNCCLKHLWFEMGTLGDKECNFHFYLLQLTLYNTRYRQNIPATAVISRVHDSLLLFSALWNSKGRFTSSGHVLYSYRELPDYLLRCTRDRLKGLNQPPPF